jgi:ribose-phosphate pyrophosphokinase
MKSLDSIESFTFPDGQPHIRTALGDDMDCIECSIRSPVDLFKLSLLCDVKRPARVTFHYLMGGRMDRAIDSMQPNTLRVVANTIKSMGIPKVGCVFPHSSTTLDRLEADHLSTRECHFIWAGLQRLLTCFNATQFSLVLPDAGAEKRFYNDHLQSLAYLNPHEHQIVTCSKMRDMQTGKLSGFQVHAPEVRPVCLIVDDLCDGGGTFAGISKQLRAVGAQQVGLIAYHGIFSKGQDLPGIDAIYTSNSFRELEETNNFFTHKVI